MALTDGFQNASAALELAAFANSWSTKGLARQLRTAAVVSKVAAAQPPTVIDGLLESLSDLESAAFLLQEAVVRRKLPTESSAVRAVVDRLAQANHALAILPVTLLDLEEGILLPDYGIGSMSMGLPFGPTPDEKAICSSPVKGNLEMTKQRFPNVRI